MLNNFDNISPLFKTWQKPTESIGIVIFFKQIKKSLKYFYVYADNQFWKLNESRITLNYSGTHL